MSELPEYVDVVIVGAGNAALCAALAAAEQGASVLVLERAPEAESGGNTRFSQGAIKCVYDGVEDLRALMPDLTDEEIRITDFGQHPEARYYDDMGRETQYRSDPELTEVLVTHSRDTIRWMSSKGVRFVPRYGRQAFKVDGRFKFWGGIAVEASGGGPGLLDALTKAARNSGIPIAYEARVVSLLADDDGAKGVRVKHRGRTVPVRAKCVVLAAGGFEANTEWRTRYLGPGWELAKVRGTRFNTGDGIRMALDIGAMAVGNWSGCSSVSWDRNATEYGNLAVGDNYQRHSYPFGIMLNANGERFVDEGADVFSYTYTKYGRVVLSQPGQFAWQVFDRKAQPFLREEYRAKGMTRVRADTLQDLVRKLDDVDQARALETIKAFNAACPGPESRFDPNVKDGRRTEGLAIPKSNWANPIDEPPFEAYGVTCGITFTFGGVKIDTRAQVHDTDGLVIPGLYAAGEMVGGLYYFGYPSGSGLMSGAVFGRIAGGEAGRRAVN